MPPHIALPPAPAESDQKSGTEIILLVEDEPSVRLLTQYILRTHGWPPVHEAEDGFQAMDLIRRNNLHIDLLITDLVMPGMNGKELAIRLRSHFDDLKVLYMSGYSDNLPVTGGESQDRQLFAEAILTGRPDPPRARDPAFRLPCPGATDESRYAIPPAYCETDAHLGPR